MVRVLTRKALKQRLDRPRVQGRVLQRNPAQPEVEVNSFDTHGKHDIERYYNASSKEGVELATV